MIYLIHNTNNNTLKIGKSKNPEIRLKSLLTSTADNLVLLKIIEGNNDSIFKNIYKDYHFIREWYNYSDYIVNDFENHCLIKQQGYKIHSSKSNRDEGYINIVFTLFDKNKTENLFKDIKKEFSCIYHHLSFDDTVKLKLCHKYILTSNLTIKRNKFIYDQHLRLENQ